MQFNPEALMNKSRLLDDIRRDEAVLAAVMKEFAAGERYQLKEVPRPWNPGGGSSLFVVTVGSDSYFLKVKRLAVTVESKLESERVFSSVSSLKNEAMYLERVRPLSPNVPQWFRYVEKAGYGFLFLELLTPFRDVAAELSATALVEMYHQIERTVRAFYDSRIVHTDVHEHNILFRGTTPVLIDFEEARELAQSESFERSLDVVGHSSLGDVGDMPSGSGILPGRTCLARLRQVIVSLMLPKLQQLIAGCRFDSSCPFLTALDHGQDDRIYQSIDIPGLQIAGQRPLTDHRVAVIQQVAAKLFDQPFSHLDIGCNIGRFVLDLAAQPTVIRSIGVDPCLQYIELANCLAFASERRARFICAEAGTQSLAELLKAEGPIDLVTIYSVYHHIRNKQAFIRDLHTLAPRYILMEMAVQMSCYEGRSWEEELSRIREGLGMPYWMIVGESDDYKRPVVLLSRHPLAVVSSEKNSTPAPTAEQQRTQPRVSIVLPTYNHLRYLRQSIESVLSQSYRDFELIVVNDGSSDGTAAYLDGLNDPRIRVIHQENQKLPTALNNGFAAARGELFTWISADNSCAPRFLEALVHALDRHPQAGLAYSAFAWIDAADRITGIHRDQRLTYRRLLSQNPGNASFLYRRACHDRLGWYDPALEGAEDWDFWVRVAEQWPAVYVPELLYYYRLHDQSMTAQKRAQIAAASRQVFRNALARKHGRFSLNELYPTMAGCADHKQARLHAAFEFGTALLRSPHADPAVAAEFLYDAYRLAGEQVPIIANLAMALVWAGQWTQALELLPHLDQCPDKQVCHLAGQIREAARTQNPGLLAAAPLYSVKQDGIELFACEAQTGLSCSLTDSAPLPENAPAWIRRSAGTSKDDRELPDRVMASTTIPRPQPPTSAERQETQKPLVSVIIPTFNRPTMLRCAVESVLQQTYRPIEIIVVNDAGEDVEGIIRSLNTCGTITYVRHGSNKGLGAARNTGLALARGAYIAYLDDDDRFYPEHVETLASFLDDQKGDVAYTDAVRVVQKLHDGEYRTVFSDVPYSYDFDPHRLLISNYFPVLCVMHRRDCLHEAGNFDETLPDHEDWDLWIRLAQRYRFTHIKRTTAEFTWRLDGSTMTSSAGHNYQATIRKIHRRYRALSDQIPGLVALQEAFLASASAPPPQLTQVKQTASYQCSIIIPVYNRAELTSQCLDALANTVCDISWELVIVDNASTDETAALLGRLSGDVRVIRNQENLGFAKACNQGALAATGQYLVFLNNDTIPLDRWLRELVREVEEHPEVGIVGSKLLYPDGTIQHAGVVLDRQDRLPYHIYKSFPGDHPAVNQRREFQVVTGACCLIRRTLFEEAGGFDESFQNGFEDVDLCLKVRDKGYVVVYQPRSVLYHLESQTPGRKTHDEQNAVRYLDRWGSQWWTVDEDLHFHMGGYKLIGKDQCGGYGADIMLLSDVKDHAAWAHVAAAQAAALKQDWSSVRRELTLVQDWPRDPYVLSWAAMVCQKLEEFALQQSFLSRYLELTDSPGARLSMARTLLGQKDLVAADQHLQKLLTASPDHAEGLLLRGILCMQREQYREAETAFSSALQQGADRKKCLMGMGMASLGRAYAQGAWERFLQVLAENPDDAEAIHWLLRAGTAQNRWAELSHQLRNYLSRNPGDLAARFAFAGVLVRADRIDAARREHDALRALAPTYDGLAELEQAITGKETVLAMETTHS